MDGKKDVNFSLVYRSQSLGQRPWTHLPTKCVNQEKNSVMVGDFNLPAIKWDNGTATGVCAAQLVKVCQEAGVEQLMNFLTQVGGNILDLLFTNIPDRVTEVRGVGRFGKNEHTMIQSSLSVERKCVRTEEIVTNWNKADWTLQWTGM
jgi:hypothetical protein